MPPVKLALVSCGLGRIQRGFEISTARWFRALVRAGDPDLDVRLFSGGDYPEATRISTISREVFLKYMLPPGIGLSDRHRWTTSYTLEQISFALGLIPRLFDRWKADIIWTKEVPLAHILYGARPLLGLKYKIIFANGAPFNPRTYEQFDFVQQLQEESYHQACASGISPEKMRIIPNCVPIAAPSQPRHVLRARLGYRPGDWVVVCVAAWNCHHKRIDYLIEEVSELRDPSVKLLLCGHPEEDTPYLVELANRKLLGRVQWKTLAPDEVTDALHAADVFVLPSLREGLGSALIEAAMVPLPVVSHPHAGGRFILQDQTWLADLSRRGNLTQRLCELRQDPPDRARLQELKCQVSERFGDAALAGQFVEMVKLVAGVQQPLGPIRVLEPAGGR